MIDPQALDQLIDRLIEHKGLTVPEGDRETFTNDIVEKINESILRRLPDDKIPEFETLLEEGNEEKIKTFMNEEIRDMGAVVMNALAA